MYEKRLVIKGYCRVTCQRYTAELQAAALFRPAHRAQTLRLPRAHLQDCSRQQGRVSRPFGLGGEKVEYRAIMPHIEGPQIGSSTHPLPDRRVALVQKGPKQSGRDRELSRHGEALLQAMTLARSSMLRTRISG
jgi:hypothetical protein